MVSALSIDEDGFFTPIRPGVILRLEGGGAAVDRFNLDYLEMMLARLEGVKTALDVGSLDVNGSARSTVTMRGVGYLGADIQAGPNVDVVLDIAGAFADVDRALSGNRFDLVMSLNTLEHIFEPIKALDNMLGLARPGGYLLVAAPMVWEPHEWPRDFCRLLPDFFKKYAEARGLTVVGGSMLVSARDTRRSSADTRNMPEEVPARRGGRLVRLIRRAAKPLVMPGLREAWPRTSVHVTLKK